MTGLFSRNLQQHYVCIAPSATDAISMYEGLADERSDPLGAVKAFKFYITLTKSTMEFSGFS